MKVTLVLSGVTLSRFHAASGSHFPHREAQQVVAAAVLAHLSANC
jgi:hypothetical protein